MKIQKSSQDYLESMLMMQQEHGYIRSIDVAEHLGVTKPSVSYATKRLRENGYITMDREGFITLTDSGMAIAASMLDRHHTLTRFLITLGVDPKVAEEDACKIEHDISDETFAARREEISAHEYAAKSGAGQVVRPRLFCVGAKRRTGVKGRRRCGPLRPVAAAAGAAGSCMVQRLRGHCSICRYRAFSASERVPTRSIRPSATASSP